MLPNAIQVVLPYGHSGVQTTTSGRYTQTFRGNGLYDPDYSGVGHQPRGFDQWANLYQAYYVYKVQINIYLGNTDTNTDTAGTLFLHQNDNLTTPHFSMADATYSIMERMVDPKIGAKWKHFSASGAGNSQWVFMKATYYPNTFLKDQDFEQRTAGFTADPVQQTAIHVQVKMDQTGSNRTFFLQARLFYHAILFDPVVFGAS